MPTDMSPDYTAAPGLGQMQAQGTFDLRRWFAVPEMFLFALIFATGALALGLSGLFAILSHGGHHFSDVLGGLVVFVLAYGCARLLVRQ